MGDMENSVRKVLNTINTSRELSNMFKTICKMKGKNPNILLNYAYIKWFSIDITVQRLCELYGYIVSALTINQQELSERLFMPSSFQLSTNENFIAISFRALKNINLTKYELLEIRNYQVLKKL